MPDFGDRLKTLRLEHGLTQKQFGVRIHVTNAVISKYEGGLSYPPYPTLIDIAEFFHVTTDFLLGRKESRIVIDVSDLTGAEIRFLRTVVGLLRKREPTFPL